MCYKNVQQNFVLDAIGSFLWVPVVELGHFATNLDCTPITLEIVYSICETRSREISKSF